MDDIRDRPHLGHEDIVALNFVRARSPFVFRRHFRSGMRSQIMEVLTSEDVRRETRGMIRDGVRWYPRAEPLFMLRLFRTRFASLDQALEEIRRLRAIEACLDADQLARSSEFIVSYRIGRRHHILLCGLQQYAPGQTLDPWQPMPPAQLFRRFARAPFRENAGMDEAVFTRCFYRNAARFVDAVRRMAFEPGLIPDLAGVRNLVVTAEANIRLIDINNVSRVEMGGRIALDDKGYPVCDKSVEALWRIEQLLPDRCTDLRDPLYGHFLSPERMAAVDALHRRFHQRLEETGPGV